MTGTKLRRYIFRYNALDRYAFTTVIKRYSTAALPLRTKLKNVSGVAAADGDLLVDTNYSLGVDFSIALRVRSQRREKLIELYGSLDISLRVRKLSYSRYWRLD